jgi:lycopene cyclase domain-containing protein
MDYWIRVFYALAIVMIPFLIWDILVTGTHWQFNPYYTLKIKIFGLPPGEWLFFISVPFACLFIWQIIVTHYEDNQKKNSIFKNILSVSYSHNHNTNIIKKTLFKLFPYLIILLGLIALYSYHTGKDYSGLAITVSLMTILLDFFLRTYLLLQMKTYFYLAAITVLIFFFNGYLTARPVVIYNKSYLWNIHLGSIPIEDFIYGLSHVFLCTIIYEKLKKTN